MKLINLTVNILLLFFLCSCNSDEDKILAEIKPYKRIHMYDTNSSDENIKYISQYFAKYDKILITDVDSSDYWFNYGSSYKSTLKITPPRKENVTNGIEMLHELLIKWYDDDFIKKHFPYSLILGDTISEIATRPWKYKDTYVGSYFIATRVQNIKEMNEAEKTNLANILNNTLWTYINDNNPFLQVAPAFYGFGEEYYKLSFIYYTHNIANEWFGGVNWAPGDAILWDKMHSVGFVKPERIAYRKDSNGNIIGILSAGFPQAKSDLLAWILFLLNTPDNEVQTLINKYPIMKAKYDILVKAFTDAGINYKELGYKPTN